MTERDEREELEEQCRRASEADSYLRAIFDKYMGQLRPDDNFTWELTELPDSAYRFVVYERGLLFFGTQRTQRQALADFAGRVWLIAPYLPQLWGRLLNLRAAQCRAEQAKYDELLAMCQSILGPLTGLDDSRQDNS